MPRGDSTDQMTRAGLNLIQQALTIYDADLKLAVCNRPFKSMFGLPHYLVTPGASFEDTIRFLAAQGEYGEIDDVDSFARDRVEQARTFVPHYMERQRSNGRTISVEGSPLPEGGWVTVYTDITEIKRQERLLRSHSEELSDRLLTHAEQLAQTNRELAASNAQLEEAKRQLTEMEARIRLTTEMTPAHIAHVDRDRVYTYTNRRLSAMLPDLPRDLVGLPMHEALGEANGARLAPHVTRALQGEASVLEFSEATSGRRLRTAFTPDQDASGEIHGVYLLSTDVTEEAQARAALSQTHKRELAAQLTSGLAHDFANLLTIILGLQGRLEKLPLPTQAAELINATKAAARRGGTLLDKIARMSGPREIHPVPTDLREMFRAFTPLARAPLPEGVRLHIEITGLTERLLLDAGSLQDSLLNLVLNARDAIGATGGDISIQVRSVQDTWLEITVTDTGPGFTEEGLDTALDPFFTTKGEDGSGLGLSMVYDLTQLAGGTVRLCNGARGAEVALRLPLRRVTEDSRTHLILLVEDQSELREMIRDMLIDMGHQVIEAASAEEARGLIDLPGLTWVLSDINLEGEVDGVSLLEDLAAEAPSLSLALMTALPHDHLLRQRGAARWPVLSKPVDPGALTHLFLTEQVA